MGVQSRNPKLWYSGEWHINKVMVFRLATSEGLFFKKKQCLKCCIIKPHHTFSFRGYRTTVRPGRGFVGTNRDTSSSSSGSGSEVGHWGQAAQGGVLVHISLPHSSSASAYVSTRNRPGSSHHHRHRGGYGGRNIRRSQKCAPTSVRRWSAVFVI